MSDRTGWWQLYRSDRSGRPDRVVIRNPPDEAEFGRPAWVFGTATWACAGPSQLIVSYAQRGRWHLATVDVASGMLSPFAPELQPDEWIAADASSAVVVAGSDTAPDRVVRIDIATRTVVSDSYGVNAADRGGRYLGTRSDRISDSGRPNCSRVLLRTAKQGLQCAGCRGASLNCHHPRRTDSGRERHAGSADSVLDEPWFRARGRQLRRQLGVRPRLP